jgi:hypothetical protein
LLLLVLKLLGGFHQNCCNQIAQAAIFDRGLSLKDFDYLIV